MRAEEPAGAIPPPGDPRGPDAPRGSASKEHTGPGRVAAVAAEPWGASHRLVALWLLATAPLLLLPGHGLPLRISLLALHLALAGLLLAVAARRVGNGDVEGSAGAEGNGGPAGALADWLPLLIAPAFYWEIPILAGVIHHGVHYDAVVQGWEAALFGGQPSRTLGSAWPWTWLSEPLHAAYLSFYLFIIVPPAVLEALGRRAAVRAVIFTVVLAAVAHAAVFVLFPVLGPRYLFPPPAGALADGPLYQLTHWVLARGSSPGTAFPSSHVGIAVAVTGTLWRVAPRAAPWVAVVAAALAFATVYGGFHYAVDALAGAALGTLLALAAPRLRRRLGSTPQSREVANVSHEAGSPVS